jgi:endonuclease/exonuclease/phosphatase family metal-dependent hydrolase
MNAPSRICSIATWNLNHRCGSQPFRPEAVKAIAALQADVVVLTEYYPQEHDSAFRAVLSDAGWPHSIASDEANGETANRVLIASRLPIERHAIALPTYDRQFPPNILSVTAAGLRLIGVRIPAYVGKDRTSLLTAAWDWLESTMARLHDGPTAVLGDLNVNAASRRLQRILAAGWRRAAPVGGDASYFGHTGKRSEIDHILGNSNLAFVGARYVTQAGAWCLAGSKGALSDHAALVADIWDAAPSKAT